VTTSDVVSPAPLSTSVFPRRWREFEPLVRGRASKLLRCFTAGKAQKLTAASAAGFEHALATGASVWAGLASDPALLEDVVQQVALELWQNVLRDTGTVLDSPEDLRRWLCVTTRRVVARQADRAARFGFASGCASDEDEDEDTPKYGELVSRGTPADVLVEVKQKFENLPQRDQQVLTAAVEGRSHAEVAQALGTNEGTSRGWRSRLFQEFHEAAE